MAVKQILSWCPCWSKEDTGPLTTNSKTESEIQALSQEMKLTKKVVDKENAKWFPCTRKDVTREQSLVIRLANRLIEMLSKVFAGILAISNDRPMTVEEEKRLARVAKELQNAYKITGQDDLAENMAQEVESAKGRAKALEEQGKKETQESDKARVLVRWAKDPKNDSLRNLPVICRIFWTRHGANEEAARIRVRLSEQNVQKHIDYPVLLKPCLQEVIIHKQTLVKFLKPGTREHFAVSREIQEHFQEIKRMEALETAERKVESLAKKADLSWKVSERLKCLGELVAAKKHLASLLTMNTPKHKAIGREIQRLEAEMRDLRASLRSST